jgi:hypothetical protein
MFRYCRIAGAAALIALAAGTGDAAAQVRLSVGGGPTFPVGNLGDEFDMGYHVQLSAGLMPAMLPVGLRIDGAYNRFPEDDGHFRVIVGSVNAVLDIPMQGFSPYLIGGLGVYSSGGDDDHGHPTTTNVGANVGAGFRVGLPGLSVFVESRFHNIFSEGEQTRFVPVTLGIRL